MVVGAIAQRKEVQAIAIILVVHWKLHAKKLPIVIEYLCGRAGCVPSKQKHVIRIELSTFVVALGWIVIDADRREWFFYQRSAVLIESLTTLRKDRLKGHARNQVAQEEYRQESLEAVFVMRHQNVFSTAVSNWSASCHSF